MASDLIRIDDVIEIIKNYGKDAIGDGLQALDPVDDIAMLARAIAFIPTVDAVEVVRCKDCLNGKQIPRYDLYVGCMVLDKVMCGDDYCSWGVKQDGGDRGE